MFCSLKYKKMLNAVNSRTKQRNSNFVTGYAHLWNDWQLRPKISQSHLSNGMPVDDDSAFGGLDDPEQGQGHRWLSCSCASNYANLMAKTRILTNMKILLFTVDLWRWRQKVGVKIRVIMSEAKFLTVPMAAFCDNKQALYDKDLRLVQANLL